MRKMQILYLHVSDEQNPYSDIVKDVLIEYLSANHDIECYDNNPENQEASTLLQIKQECYDLVFVQNSQSLLRYKSLSQIWKNTPLIFVSYSNDIHGYIAPIDNLAGVFKFGNADLISWGIPDEIQTCLKIPTQKISKNSHKKKGAKIPHIVYYPTKNSIATADGVLVSILKRLNKTKLTIVSDTHSVLTSSFPTDVRVISRKNSLSILQKADVVIASCFDAIQAVVDAKPCVILGDYGLGGLVQPDNYDILQKWDFQGRAGASFQEYIPNELLIYEINKALYLDRGEYLQYLQKRITEDYNELLFQEKISERLKHILSVSGKLKNRKTLLQLKPALTSVFSLEEIEDIAYVKRGNNYFSSIDGELQMILKQCNGENTIQDIVDANELEKEDISVLCANLRELEKKKLIVFYE